VENIKKKKKHLKKRVDDGVKHFLSFLFFLGFKVQAEEISDEEWRQMMTDDLRRHGVLGQIVDAVPPYIVNVDYADHACVHMGNQLVPRQTQLQPQQVK
jgi:hypothetical protein